MAHNDENNIFNMAGKHSPKPKPKPKPAVAKQSGWVKGKLPPPPDPAEEKELRERYQKVLKLRDDLQRKVETIYSEGGMTKESVTRYLNNSSNYTDEEYQETQKRRKILREELWKMTGDETKEKVEKKEALDKLKKKKRKTLGARRQNWINMR